ncbi:isoprenylcysteine carboxylmethyltransferase family protein [Chelativorans sp. AA-79]|uniref:methyltransferase family protein n=1 Tax=Chelativorans sp. AA-79 TaxID=3028735 RepID=UPI0023F667DF|nr:isoprenylcysteine carboxylmethyltransferase family protein [Chelativorans sp. AA-79]WEX11632.1 isoprenylcysteine carboxylmethyltransferase family protein [Chelativorans sp. AA-79]
MSQPTDAPPSRIPWPPILYLVAVALGILAGVLLPSPWFGSPLADILFAAGWLMVIAALAMDIAALRALRRAGTTILPTRTSAHLVTGGPYAFSRNPIYLGNTMLVIGIGLITGNPWFFLFAILAAFATQKLAVEPEERHLAQRFGKHYRDYQKRARRWF